MLERSIVIAHGGDLSDATGGTNRIIAFALALANNGFDVHLVIPKPKKSLPDCIKGIAVHTIPVRERGVWNQLIRAFLVSIKAKAISKKYNAILQIELSTLAGVATLIGCSNYILDVNDISIDDPQYVNLPFSKYIKNFIYHMEKRAVLNASKIIVVSAPMGQYIRDEWNVSERKIEIIPNGFFDFKLNRATSKNSIDDKMIVTLGTLFKHLDVDLIINLAKVIQKDGIKIYLVGDGVLRSSIENRARIEELDNIVITGWLPYADAMKFVNKSILAFHTIKDSTTTRVACPVKILDYAAIGKPMVLSDVSELAHILKNNNLALVSSPNEPNEFIKNVFHLIEDEQLRVVMSERLVDFAGDFTWEAQGNKLVRLIESIEEN
jgi:glycosyltransferase involved in cell wall biosynthesis